jgi:hypothetical protein
MNAHAINRATRPAARTDTGVTAIAAAVVLAALLASGCRIHRDTNAPGHIDLDTPPRAPAQGGDPPVEAPSDPGERMVTLNPGVFGGFGGRFARDGDRGTGFVGVELTLNRGASSRSHNGDDFFVYPWSGRGASLGWTIAQFGDEASVGPIYAEVHGFKLWGGLAAGYAVDVGDRVHGPQVTAWFLTYLVRARYMVGGGFELYIGGQLKLPFVWISSQ